MQDEIAQDQSCALCGARLTPFTESPGEAADFRAEEAAGRDRLICPACNTYLRYMEGSNDEP